MPPKRRAPTTRAKPAPVGLVSVVLLFALSLTLCSLARSLFSFFLFRRVFFPLAARLRSLFSLNPACDVHIVALVKMKETGTRELRRNTRADFFFAFWSTPTRTSRRRLQSQPSFSLHFPSPSPRLLRTRADALSLSPSPSQSLGG